jgi:EAL domain-containing protein (putative c-di-GMP-specific phosphodiesterase class I)/GGDEF domain-containing protein
VQALGQTPHILSSGHQTPDFYQAMCAALHRDGQWPGEIWNRRENGEVYAELLNLSAVFDATGQVQNYVALFSDITPLKEHEKELERIAHYDVLTGLPNRVLLADRLHQAMIQSVRRRQQLAVIYLDLDDSQAAVPLLDRLLTAAGESVQLGDVALQISASLGVTFYPQVEVMEADQLLRQADQAMYLAKLAGKNRFHFFDAEKDRSTRGHFESLERIRHALAAQELVLYYQPKVNMRNGVVIGVEALIRWQHPERGLLAPALFLPVIEAHALAVTVGEWVIDSALSQIEQWQNDGLVLPESFNVSVNVGARQLQQGNFVAFLQTLLAAHPQIRPAQLEVEILETSALSDLAGLSRLIDDCHRLGVLFALDDFGTGYSSLSYLKHLRVSVLKMDQSFVRDMLDDPDDPDDLAILRGVIGLADAFNRRVIAEGVETEAHGRSLLKMGCELGQGYAIARPMPAQAFPQWLWHWQQNPLWGVADVALAARSA